MSSPPSSTDDPSLFPNHTAFDASRLVGSPEDIRKLVDREIQRRRQVIDENINAITELRTFQNTLTPVNALPTELLGAVFVNLVSRGDLLPKPSWRVGDNWVHRRGESLIDPPRGNRDIVGASGVCRYWRTVVIQNPWLWISFPIHHCDGVQEFLARSKDLHISLSLTHRFPSSVAPILAPSAYRIRSLYISTELANDIELLWAKLSSPAPNLQEFFIEYLPHGHMVGQGVQFPPMFDGKAPSLRVLTLRGVPSPFRVLPASLVHLEIGTRRGPIPRFADLLEMLTGCTLLETFNLCGAWDWDEFQHHLILRNNTALPKLSTMYLELEPEDATGFLLSSLILPPHTNVFISNVLEDGGSFGGLLHIVDPQLGPSCFNGFRRLQLFREGENWRLQAFRDPDAFVGSPALDVYCIDPWGETDVDWTGFLFGWPFDASGIETFVVCHKGAKHIPLGGGDPFDLNRTSDQWDLTFGQLPALKTLRVVGLPAYELDSLLDELQIWSDAPPHMSCSSLVALEVFDVPVSDKAAEAILNVAIMRRPHGAQTSTLKRVELFNSKPSSGGLLRCLEAIPLGVEIVIDEEIMSGSGVVAGDIQDMDVDMLMDIL